MPADSPPEAAGPFRGRGLAGPGFHFGGDKPFGEFLAVAPASAELALQVEPRLVHPRLVGDARTVADNVHLAVPARPYYLIYSFLAVPPVADTLHALLHLAAPPAVDHHLGQHQGMPGIVLDKRDHHQLLVGSQAYPVRIDVELDNHVSLAVTAQFRSAGGDVQRAFGCLLRAKKVRHYGEHSPHE